MTCVCGCGQPGVHRHHVVTAQEIRKALGYRASRRKKARSDGAGLLRDARNLVPMAFVCHGEHHSRMRPLPLEVLPDSVFEFAAEVLGRGRAFNYLRRHYNGGDARLDALVGS